MSEVNPAAATFEGMTRAATGLPPHPYQQRLAAEGLPEVLEAPTGAGKTQAVILAWLYRRRLAPDPEVRAATPRWLVFTLPMRVLVEQVRDCAATWLRNLRLDGDVGLHVLMGGESSDDDMRLRPHRDAIIVGTIDMVLSRALNRGYGESRWIWPIDFGLLSNGCHFVFDEVQLMGPGLPTSRQLEGLRRSLGTALPCASTWMSATLDPERLATVDLPDVPPAVGLGNADRTGSLQRRLEARKQVVQLEVDPARYEAGVATALQEIHRPGTRTIAILNTVDRAVQVHSHLRKHGCVAEAILVHSRFRPVDRARQLSRALSPVKAGSRGVIVISTQVLEAGVDISSETLVTEAAPWPAIVQRAGRCNRGGEAADARLVWMVPARPAPYEQADIDAAVGALQALEGQAVTPASLGAINVPTTPALHSVLRRRDLLDLFDTTPDLAGDDIDVSRFIRESDQIDVDIAWREFDSDAGPNPSDPLPSRDERCSVTLADARSRAKGGHRLYRFDHIAERWARCGPQEFRPGMTLLAASRAGGYTVDTGWTPASTIHVPPVETRPSHPLDTADTAVGSDPVTFGRRWLSLVRHLNEVEDAVRELASELGSLAVPAAAIDAAAVAGRLHDIGKAHPCFQAVLAGSARDDAERAVAERAGRPWAKSASGRGPANERPHFRHELASLLVLLDGGSDLLANESESDLILYLVAAHHGRVRLGARSLAGEKPGRMLGIEDREAFPAVEVPGGVVEATMLKLDRLALGDAEGAPSWSDRALRLRDRPDLGPFRLAFLEALVRLADWRASRGEAQSS